MPITLEARTHFVRNVTKLSLWLGRRRSGPGAGFSEWLTRHTPVYRLTALWDGERHPAHPPQGWSDASWDAAVRDLAEMPVCDEDAGLRRLWPLLQPRIRRDVADWPHIPSGIGTERRVRLFGFFLYDLTEFGRATTEMNLHMGNTQAPESPFHDVPARAGELARLLRDAQSLKPDMEWIQCASWLNTFAPFLRLFPAAWAGSATPPRPPGYSYGWWGQFVWRDGRFHKRNGEHLRRTGQFPFPAVVCRCRIASLRQHLRQCFGVDP